MMNCDRLNYPTQDQLRSPICSIWHKTFSQTYSAKKSRAHRDFIVFAVKCCCLKCFLWLSLNLTPGYKSTSVCSLPLKDADLTSDHAQQWRHCVPTHPGVHFYITTATERWNHWRSANTTSGVFSYSLSTFCW